MKLSVTSESVFAFHISFESTDGQTVDTMLTQSGGEWRLSDPLPGKTPWIGGPRIDWPEALKRALVALSSS